MNEALKKLSFKNPIILIDGECILCHGFTQFFIKRDKKSVLRFGNLQDSLENFKPSDLESVILFLNGELYFKSSAGIRAFMYLGGFWKLTAVLLLVPKFIRDWVYGIIAKNRYKWFGKYEECIVPKRNIMVDSSS